MTIALSTSAAEPVAVNGTVTFNVDNIKPRNICTASEYHRPNTGVVHLRKPGIYDIMFNGNVTTATAGDSVQFNIMLDGAPIPGSTMIQTIGTANSFENIASGPMVRIFCGDAGILTVENTGTVAATLGADANLTVTRKSGE